MKSTQMCYGILYLLPENFLWNLQNDGTIQHLGAWLAYTLYLTLAF